MKRGAAVFAMIKTLFCLLCRCSGYPDASRVVVVGAVNVADEVKNFFLHGSERWARIHKHAVAAKRRTGLAKHICLRARGRTTSAIATVLRNSNVVGTLWIVRASSTHAILTVAACVCSTLTLFAQHLSAVSICTGVAIRTLVVWAASGSRWAKSATAVGL